MFFKKHIKLIHKENKPFNCNICEYETVQATPLKEHIESVRKGIKPFHCKICD